MNIAFPAALLFALLFPGIVFHHFCQDREVREAEFSPFSKALFTAIIAACACNAVTALLVHVFWNYNVLAGDALRLLIGNVPANAQASVNAISARLNEHPFEPIGFFVLSVVLACLSAAAWRWAVRRFGLDRTSCPLHRFIRASAPWYYLFRAIDADQVPDGVLVAAIVPLKDCSYLFTGLLEDYFLTPKGDLDRLVLSGASRRKLENDSGAGNASEERFYPIDGDYIVIRQSEWVTLNFKYLVVQGDVPDVVTDVETITNAAPEGASDNVVQ